MADPWASFQLRPATPVETEADPWAEFGLTPAKKPPSESSTLFGDATAQTTLGELGAGLQSGARQVISTVPTIGAFGVRKFEDWTGVDTKGLDEALMQTAVETAQGGAKRGIDKVEELELMDPSTWTRYVAGTVGEAVPFIASILTGAGGASYLARLMAQKGISGGSRSAILRSIPPSFAGATATAAAIESASTGQELFQAKKDIYTGASLLAGSAKGALESIFPLMLGKAVGLTGRQADDLLARVLSSPSRLNRVAAGAATEAGTELLQEEVDLTTRNYIDENFGYLSPEANSRRLNAFVGGGVGGGVFSALTPSRSDAEVLNEHLVKSAAGDVPYYTGQSPDELPTIGPDAAVDASLSGLDATVGIANLAELDALQSSVDIRHRGLFAAAIPGTELTFGSQDQALNDGANAQVAQYMRLDPDKITRKDLSVSVEDLPDSLVSPRVDFLSQDTMKEASDKLVQAIKIRQQSISAKSPSARENFLSKAAAVYRQAMDLGARVEPFADSQVVLRDPTKHQALMESQGQEQLSSQMTKAQLLLTRKRPGGGEFYVFSRPEKNTESKGKTVDLERIRPEDVTAFPSRELSRQIQADQQIARKMDLGRARAKGIRFSPSLDESTQKQLLGDFVKFLQGAGLVKRQFDASKEGTAEKFMSLVDRGLRLDVTTETPRFAMLRRLAPAGFGQDVDVIGPEVAQKGRGPSTVSRLVKQRARRTGEPRVSKRIVFQDKNVQNAFMSQFHNTDLRTMLSGTEGQGKSQTMNPGVSPLGDMIRDIVKGIRLKTDIVLEIVAPGFNPGGKGVHYEDKTIVLSPGKKGQSRSVLQIDPWAYGRQTQGQKALIKNPGFQPHYFAERRMDAGQKRGWAYAILPLTQTALKQTGRTVLEVSKEFPGATYVLAKQGAVRDGWKIYEGGKFDQLLAKIQPSIDSGSTVPVESVSGKDTTAWLRAEPGETVATPKAPAEKLSQGGKAAEAIGAPGTKMFVENEQKAEFFTDIMHELSKVVVVHEWEAMGAAQQELLTTAYRRERHAMAGRDKATQLARVIPHPILSRTIAEQRGRHKSPYNFEEWLVSNITRRYTQPNTPIGPVQKFFQKAANIVKNVLDAFMARIKNKDKPYFLDLNLGRPNQIVDSWLTKLEARGRVVDEEPFLSEATRRALNDSINRNVQNVKALGLDEYVTMYPERSSSFRVKQLLKIFPEGADAERAKVKGLLAMSDRYNTMMDWLLGVHQIADLNPHIRGLQDYKSLNRALENTALSWSSLADKRIRQVRALGKEQADNLYRFMFELDQMTYLTQKERAEEITRWPTEAELLTLAKGHKLNKDAFQAYVDTRQDFLQFLSYLEEVSVQKATETVQDPLELAKEINSIAGEVAQMKARPYFPHMRFGKYVVTVRDSVGKVLHFEAFHSTKERDDAVVRIEKKYKVPNVNSIVEDELSPTLQQWQGLPAFALRNIERELGLDKPDLTAKQKKDKKLLEALALQAAPTTSFRRQLLERQNTPGFSSDGLRAYGTYFARAARYVARQEYTKRLEASIKDIRDSGSPISKDTRSRIADYVTRHYENLMAPAGDWAEARALGYLWYFAYVPAAAFVNLTQVPMVSMPYLANKFGDIATMAKVTKAFGEVSRDYFNELRGSQPKDEGILSEAIEEAHESRLIDDGFAQELAAISQGSVLQRTLAENKFGRELRRIGQWGVAPFTLAEKFNRAVTFRAAYKMALEDNNSPHVDEVMGSNKQEADQLRIDRGWDEPHLRAYMVAADAVRTTQFEYSRWARPRIMEGPRGVVLMFKSYLQNMLFFLFKQDRGAQARMLLMMMGAAGIMGLPGADDASELTKWLLRQFGIQFDFEKTLRGLMTDWAEGISPDIVLHGASRVGFGIPAVLNGLGIPSMTPDLSGTLSMGKMIPGLESALNPTSANWREIVGSVTSEVAGPWLGVPFAMYQSITDSSLPADDIKRWERAMPRALRGLERSSRLMAEQRERDRGGATVVDFDPNDWSDQMDIMSVAAGFSPTQMNRQWDYLRAQMEVQEYWKGQRNVLTRELFRAHRLKDKEGKEDAIEAIKKFNAEAPDKALRITSETVKRSLQTKSRNLEMKERGVTREKSLRGVTDQVDALYPEAVTRREKVPTR
jgi:hypothetical protein